MREKSLHYKVREQLSQLSSSEVQGVAREEIFKGPRLGTTRRLERDDYQIGSAFRRSVERDEGASADLARSRLPAAPIDVPTWRVVIAQRSKCFNSLVALLAPAFEDLKQFPAVAALLREDSYAPPEVRIRSVIEHLDFVSDRELRRLLSRRNERQEANREGIKTLFPKLKQEVIEGLAALNLRLKMGSSGLPLHDIEKRLDAVALEVFDPLLSKSFTDIAFCSCFSHAIFISDDLCETDYAPILRHELLHAVAGLAPIVARAGSPDVGNDQLLSAVNQSFLWERYGVAAYDGKPESYTWLNEGVTEFLNQEIGRGAGKIGVSVHGWSRMAEVMQRVARRVDISPLLQVYFSDAPLNDPQLCAHKDQFQKSLARVYGASFLDDLEKAWIAEHRQDAVCNLYDERFSRRGWPEAIGSVFRSLGDTVRRLVTGREKGE